MTQSRGHLPLVAAAVILCGARALAPAQPMGALPRASAGKAAPAPAPPPVRKKLPREMVDASPNFTRGDWVEFDWRRTLTIPAEKGRVVSESVSGTVRVDVLAVSETEIHFAWTWGPLRYNSQGRMGIGETELLAETLSNQRVEFALSKTGQVRGLRNFAVARSALLTRLNEVVDARRPPLGENPVLEQLRESLAASLERAESAEDLLLPDMSAMFTGFVGPISSWEQARLDSELTNPFGGEPFPASATVAVIDLSAASFTIGWAVSVKPEHVAGIMAETVKKMEIRGGKRRPVPKVLSVSVKSQGEVVITRGSTWPVEGRLVQTVLAENRPETTTTVWKQRPRQGPGGAR